MYELTITNNGRGRIAAHRTDCPDIARKAGKVATSGGASWQIKVDSQQAAVENVFSDMIEENEGDTWEDYRAELPFLDCCPVMPVERPSQPQPPVEPALVVETAPGDVLRRPSLFELTIVNQPGTRITAHSVECADPDAREVVRAGGNVWTVVVGSVQEVVESIFGDLLSPLNPDGDTWEDWSSELLLAPCCPHMPTLRPVEPTDETATDEQLRAYEVSPFMLAIAGPSTFRLRRADDPQTLAMVERPGRSTTWIVDGAPGRAFRSAVEAAAIWCVEQGLIGVPTPSPVDPPAGMRRVVIEGRDPEAGAKATRGLHGAAVSAVELITDGQVCRNDLQNMRADARAVLAAAARALGRTGVADAADRAVARDGLAQALFEGLRGKLVEQFRELSLVTMSGQPPAVRSAFVTIEQARLDAMVEVARAVLGEAESVRLLGEVGLAALYRD